jgi:hypothetical protein
VFFSVGVWGQTTLVEWNFPNNPDDATADAGIAANSAKTIVTGGFTPTVVFTVAGAATRSATTDSWNSGSATKYWAVEFITTGYSSITVSSKQRAAHAAAPGQFKLQYNVGSGWFDVTGGAINMTGTGWNVGGNLTDVALPTACENQASVQLRWIMTDNFGPDGSTAVAAGRNSSIDDIIIKGTAISCTPPTTQATIGSYTNNTTGTTLTANWTRGNGDNILVVARLTSTTAVAPSSGTSYTANAAFGSGNTTGTGNYVVYNGTALSENITALTASTSYTFDIYEYSNTGICYKTPASSSAVTTYTPPAYCALANGDSSDGDYINRVTINDLDNTSGDDGGGANYTAMTVNLSPGTSYTLHIYPYCYGSIATNQIWAFFDWNGDSDFADANESIDLGQTDVDNTDMSITVNVPIGATPGLTRMRIINSWSSNPGVDGCTMGTYGEWEDYSVNIGAPPTCFTPTAVTASSITLTTVTISWTAASPAPSNGYTYEIRTSGAAGSGATGLVVSSSTVAGDVNDNISGLTANTTYYVYVRSYCGGSDYSTWTASYSFTTLKNEPTNQPTNFSHGAVTATAIPLTWTAAVAGAQAPDGYMVKLSTGVVADPVDGTDPADDLDVAGGVANKKVTPGSATTATTFTGMAEGTMYNFKIYSYTNSGTNINYNLTSPPAINYATKPRPVNTLVFSATGTSSADITWLKHATYLDATNTIMVFVKPTSAVTAGTPTNSPTAYTANSIFGSGTAYQNDAAAYCVYKGDGTSVSITGLSASTTYHVMVLNVVDASNWDATHTYSNTEVANGQTSCVAYTIPYFEGFESGYTDGTTISGCLSQQTILGSATWMANSSLTTYNRTPRTGSFNATLYYSNDDWMFIPISLTSGTTYQFTTYARQDMATSSYADITVAYGSSGSAGAMTNSIVAETGIINGSYQRIRGYFTPTSTGTFYIGILGSINGTPYYISLDDISVIVAPTCLEPTGLSATTTLPDQSTLSWTESGTAALWDIEVGASGFSPTGTPTTTGVTNPYLLTGLTASTAYSYYVRADCGGGDYSEWAGPYTFTTAGPYMTYTSSTTTQTVTTDLNPGSTNQQIIGVQVVTTGPTNPLSLTQFNLTTNGSTSAGTDISNAKVWYTGTSSTFATTAQFGSTYSAPTGAFVVTGSQALAVGTNYFWVTYDIAPGATLNNVVDARCNQITVAAATQAPTVTNPAGSRTIKDIYLISDPSTVNVCSGTFYDSGGAASNYGDDELYTKTFVAATPGSALQFVFTSFALESCCDDLYVYDGPDDTYPQIAGSPFGTTPGTIYSSSQYMTFVFDSDGSVNDAGWAATISCVAITVPNCATYTSPADAETGVCPGSVNLNWTPATTGFGSNGYKLYFGTNNPPTNIINGTDVGNITTYEVANLDGNTVFYWRIAPYNSAGDNTTCGVNSFTTLNIGITGTTGLTSCQNTGDISATGGGTITWYDVPTGGTPIGTGSPFTVTYSGNTTYYVAAEAGSGGSENGGRLTTTGVDGGFITTPNWGIVFNATEDFELVSTTIYPIGTGTVTLALLNDANTEIAVTSAINVTGTGASTPVVVPLGFDIAAGSNYKLVLKAYTGLTNIIRDFTNSFPYASPSGAISVTGGWTGSSSSSYYWFYNLAITSGCISAREPVQVVHTAEPITITPSGPTTFLNGGSVGLSASSADATYTYTWSPATGLNTTTGANVVATPNTTTTYTVTGTTGSCTNTEQVTVTVTYPCTGLGTGYAVVSTLPFNETGTTCGAVNDITSSNAIVCSSSSYYDGEDFVYSFTPASDGLVTINLASTGTYTGVMLYDGCPMTGQGGACVANSQSSTGAKSLCINLQQDITYYLIIDSDPSPACNPYTIDISSPDPNGVANDYPCDATPIAMGGLQSGENSCTSGTDEPTSASCWTTGTLNTVWYSFVAPASGSVKIRTTLGTLTATQIAVYQGACDNLTVVSNSCNVDASGACSGTTNNSAVELSGLTSGNTYLIRVDGENDLTGDFDIEIIDGTSSWPFVPQQDCGSATVICNQQTIVGDPGFLGSGSTCDYTTPYGCFSFGSENNIVWYQIDIASDGTLIYDIVPNLSTTDYDWALINVTGNPTACDQIAAGTLTPVRCNFSGTSGTTGLRASATNTSEGAGGPPFCTPLPVLAGQSYQLLIWNWSGNNTGFNLDMQATSPVNYTTPASLTWSGGASNDWFNPINWGGCDIPDCNIDVIIVNGPTNQPVINAAGAECKSISIESGASLTINATRTLNVCDDFNNIGTLNMDPTATILLNNATADHELNGSLTGANALGNLTITKAGGSVKFMQDVEIQGDFTTSNATSIVDVNGRSVSVGGDFDVWDLTYTNIGSGSLTFNGNGILPQNYLPGGGLILHNVTINNTGAGVILGRNLELDATGTLSLVNGVIDTDIRRVVLNNSDPDAVNAGNVNSYIIGDLRRNIAVNTGVYSFPVGTATAYRLAQIVNNNLTGITYIDGSFLSSFTNTGSLNTAIAQDGGTPYQSIASEGVWRLDPNAVPSGGDYSIILWFDGGGSNAFASMVDNEFAPLKRPSGSTTASAWTAAGGAIAPADAVGRTVAGGYARRNGLSSFSEHTIGKSEAPLPIVLLYFDAKCSDDDINLNWATAQEINNSHFTILRSTDGKYFYPVAKIDGAGNSSEPIHYPYVDKFSGNNGNVYYKLEQTDFDGKSTQSNMIVVNCSEIENPEYVRIINNLNSETIDIHYLADLDSKSYISVIDNLGRILYNEELDIYESRIVRIDKTQFAPGIYTIVVNINKAAITDQFVIVK